MMKHDRQGLIDDMLQLLRERGVIKDCVVSMEMSSNHTYLDEPDYQRYLRGQAGDQMGYFLQKEGHIKIEFKPSQESDMTKTMVGTLTVVRNKP